ncbi:cation:proton antiporter [Candidatus Saccharibacteria bacterium]|nr:cation:proton antiporter [Candidatus Saccharibacteria bacterium]
MESVFAELSLVIVITAFVSLFMKLIRQPLILGYILSGLLVGPSVFGLIHSVETFEAFSSIGIALLLFIIGLGMNVSELRKLGRVVVVIAISSLVTVGTIGFAASGLMGFTRTESLIIGLSLFFSSTIIIVKILSDKKEQNRLHGQIAIGVILVEDIIATFALLFIVAGQGDGLNISEIAVLLGRGAFLVGVLAFCSTQVLPRVSKYMASSQELLFLFAIAWGFGVATLFELSGFSIEVGALFGGVALAASPYAQEISARLKPLRDFFIVLFFIALGESLNVTNLSAGIWPALVLSAIVIIIKPFTITSIMGVLGYTKRISFKAGINLSQISEFSIVLVVLATTAGLVRPEISAIITLVAIITIASSAYLMQFDDELFARFDRIKLHLFEKEVTYKEKRAKAGYAIVLFGYHHGGHEFIKTFKDIGRRYLVIDYDPSVIDTLEHQDVPYLYGDATDSELLEEININNTKLIISTFSDFEVTTSLVKNINRINSSAVIICHADNKDEAVKLYELGATYVMIPHYIGSEKISAFIKKSGLKKSEFTHFREKHLTYLESHFPNIES